MNVQNSSSWAEIYFVQYPNSQANQFEFKNKKVGKYYFSYYSYNRNNKFYYHLDSKNNIIGGLLSITLFKVIDDEFTLYDFEYDEDIAMIEYIIVEETITNIYYKKINTQCPVVGTYIYLLGVIVQTVVNAILLY